MSALARLRLARPFSSFSRGGRLSSLHRPPPAAVHDPDPYNVPAPPAPVHLNHPPISSRDLKLHHFFAAHRPLLLLTAPAATLFSPPPAGTPLLPDPASSPPLLSSTFDGPEPPAADADADADAARQITRALMLHRAGPAVAWQGVLAGLGLDLSRESDRVGLQAQWAREWEDVRMDSTKRKRRKKMKKHKLRKRRKATRAQRLQLE